MCSCVVLNIGCGFLTVQVSVQLGSHSDRSGEGEMHRGLMIQKKAFREDGGESEDVSVRAHLGTSSNVVADHA